jgi:DNA-binding response OmpR family regulator
VLSALDTADGKVRALELGADDYLVKPVESRELVSRIKVMIDRADGSGCHAIQGTPPGAHRGLSTEVD